MNFTFQNMSAENFVVQNENFLMGLFNSSYYSHIFSGILVNYCIGIIILFVIRGIIEHRYFKLWELNITIGKYSEKVEFDNAFFIGIFDTLILFCLAIELVILKLYY